MLPALVPNPTPAMPPDVIPPLLLVETTVSSVPLPDAPPAIASPDLEPDPAAALLAAPPAALAAAALDPDPLAAPAEAAPEPEPAAPALAAEPLDPVEPAMPREPPELVEVDADEPLVDADTLPDVAPAAADPPFPELDDEALAAPLDSPGRLPSVALEAEEADPLDVAVDNEAAPPPTSVVVVVAAASAGNELLNRSRVAAPNSDSGFVIALSNHAPDEAPPDASKFWAVPAILAIGRETVSSILALIPSPNILLALDRLVAMFCTATPAVVTGLPTVSL